MTISFNVCIKRTFLERDWDAFRRFKAPEPKSALLRDAENDGDVYLLTKVKIQTQQSIVLSHNLGLLELVIRVN